MTDLQALLADAFGRLMADVGPLLLVELLALGASAGFLAGLFGIGGGMLMVPILILIFGDRGLPDDYLLKMAVATSLSTILFTSVASLRAHHRRGAVRWDIVWRFVPGILVGSLVGPQIARALPARVMASLFAIFVAYSAVQMFLNRKPSPSRQLPGWFGLTAVGVGIGILSALVGAGGGFVSIPFMVWCNVVIHQAVGTSAALGLPIALAGAVGYVLAGRDLVVAPWGAFGYLYLPLLIPIAMASVLTARHGAAAAHRLDVAHLKKAFAALLFALAAFMVYKAVRS